MWRSTLAQFCLTKAALVIAFLTPPPAMAASMYSVTDLGTLPGYQSSSASDINHKGQVVGRAFTNAFNPFRAFIWENGTMTDLGTLPDYAASSEARSLNDLGQVVGVSYDALPSRRGWNVRAFLWSANNGMIDLGTLGGQSSLANGINDLGQVVGSANTSNGQGRAFRTSPNSPINPATDDLGTLSDRNGFSGATDINNQGQVLGYISVGQGITFLWENNTIIELNIGGASAINNRGQIAGSPLPGVSSAGVIWTEGAITDLGTLGGSGGANDINELGQVVGGVSTPRGFHAYLWENGVLYDLNDLIPADSGWELTTATAINNNGQIVGSGTINGQESSYLLVPVSQTTPVPEPNYAFEILMLATCGAFSLLKRKDLL
ncbi:hypothetical protein F7734_34560 [Scytonema sp. UIC 10036]|uniref:hypothetical protein n=1 Tax=Scytonema sp. UIC 10036 TaxID=2304196 RepID=UPI0012DA2A59|nr:hypothetical protein [Scytonema sp. UIC 10036]MUG97181.1 hypothetical protein [Scytonema sp. UIC 10036]